MKKRLITLYTAAVILTMSFFSWAGAQETSPLSQGQWLRLSVEQSGVYKIRFSTLKEHGFSDPRHIRVFGQGGKMMSESIEKLPQNRFLSVPLWYDNEALYFYAHGPIVWRYDNEKQGYVHDTNPYSSKGYYLLTENAHLPENLVESAPNQWAHPTQTENSYDYYTLHEIDRISPKMSGRILFGESINLSNPLNIQFQLPDTPLTDEHSLHWAYMALPKSSSTLTVNTATTSWTDVIKQSEDYSSSTYLAGIYHDRHHTFSSPYSSPEIQVSLSISPTDTHSLLDFVALTTTLPLKYRGASPLYFRKKGNQESVIWQIGNAPQEGHLWAVLSDKVLEVHPYEKGYPARLQENGKPIEYCFFVPQDIPEIHIEGSIPNQNILAVEDPDYIIVAPDLLLEEAQRLAEYHRTESGLKVAVFTQKQVMNEFNGSTPDATAYRFMLKTFRDRYIARTGDTTFAPLFLLFGDGASDNRKVSDEWRSEDLQNTEFLLTYQSINSLNVYSYTADDYFGSLASTNTSDKLGEHQLNASIGRLPLRTPNQARAVVDKIIEYDRNSAMGDWKTRICYVADNKDGGAHLRDADASAVKLQKILPEINISKIYSDTYAVKTVNGKSTIPDARRKLMDELKNGLLLINYVGHGGPAAWTDEQILTLNDIVGFRYSHLPVWITATCDFTNFDHPVTSAGEEAMLNPKSGAAALFTTTRVVFSLSNKDMNLQLSEHLFTPEKDGQLKRMGDVIRLSKNAMSSSDTINKLNFTLIGDPAVRLKLPPMRAQILTIAGKEVASSNNIILKASEKVHIRGAVTNTEGTIQGDFSGNLFVAIYDSEQYFFGLKENGYTGDQRPSYKDYSGVIFKGIVSVQNGYFDFDFIVPKDVSYGEGYGKISLYASDPDHRWEAIGSEHCIQILPGLPDQPLNDNTPPEIRSVKLGNSSFEEGMTVCSTPLFVANLFDESGLNISGNGIGHDMMLVIDGREDYTFVLNSYYQASLQEYGLGEVIYMLPELEEGDHSALFTIWDVANNVTRKEFSFRVEKGKEKGVVKSRIFPNPASPKDPITIQIFNDHPGIEFRSQIEIFNAYGIKVAQSPEFVVETSWDAPFSWEWKPQTTYGVDLAPGTYLCRISTQREDGVWSSDSTPLIILPSSL